MPTHRARALHAQKIAVRWEARRGLARGGHEVRLNRWGWGHGGIGSPAALTKSMLRNIRTTPASPIRLTAVTSESEASASDELNAREDSVSTDSDDMGA